MRAEKALVDSHEKAIFREVIVRSPLGSKASADPINPYQNYFREREIV